MPGQWLLVDHGLQSDLSMAFPRSLPDLLQSMACAHADDFAWAALPSGPSCRLLCQPSELARRPRSVDKCFCSSVAFLCDLFFVEAQAGGLSMAARLWITVARKTDEILVGIENQTATDRKENTCTHCQSGDQQAQRNQEKENKEPHDSGKKHSPPQCRRCPPHRPFFPIIF